MRRVCIIFIFVLVLTACQVQAANITLNDVIVSLENQHLDVEETRKSTDNIFNNKLNGIKPNNYTLQDKSLLIYIFDSEENRKKGFKDFQKQTESLNTVSHGVYEVKNVLIFYVYEKDLDNSIEEGLQQTINNLERLAL
ncbi:hypothetical protein [uncultured Psychrobacillus sp.]|uniref:hypothetical protein n=1 Tax=uncultured Psychrobacillus sp. TaxID=1551585 RepID=UPI0026116635|nr:hypothetical protein [uncultured Psychrobacillus sp.]